MRGWQKAALPGLAVLLMAAGSATGVAPTPGVAPFGDQISEQRLPEYNRATPLIATSGPIGDDGVIEAKRVGFAMIVDLRPAADASSEKQRADFARIRYANIPVQGIPTADQVKQFASIVTDRSNLPLLLHGANVDQSGAMWALYRASLGVPPAVAVEDGMTAGLGRQRHRPFRPGSARANRNRGGPMIAVDGVVIPEDLISLETQLQDAADPAAAWESAARGLVVRQLLLAEAAARGISDKDPEPGEEPDEAAIRRLLEAELHLPEPAESELRRWYDRNGERLRLPDLWQVQHLLIAADPKDAAATEAARARAEALLAEVLDDPDRLPALARRFSDCPSKAQGGDLGLIESGSTVPEFEAHLAPLQAGEVCPTVVKSRYGMHVIRVLAHEPGRIPPFSAMQGRIAEFMQEASWRQAVQGYIAALAARARIQGFDLFEGENAPPRPSAWPAGSSCTSTDLPSGPQPGRKPAMAKTGGCC